MENEQLHLIPDTYNPLVDRLGAEWFEKVPREPGVYRMLDGQGKLLYVGKAKELRTRLLWYRRARKGRVSRKTVCLLREVRRIAYEVCESEEHALLRENALIRKTRPPFNRAKKSPETYYYVHLHRNPGALLFRLDMKQEGGEPWRDYGAFKGHRFTRRAMGALLRQCYFRAAGISRACELPLVLTRNLTPMNYCMDLGGQAMVEELHPMLDDYLGGNKDGFSVWAEEGGLPERIKGGFTANLLAADAEVLGDFFTRRTRYNQEMAGKLGLKSHLIPQSELDDVITRSRFV